MNASHKASLIEALNIMSKNCEATSKQFSPNSTTFSRCGDLLRMADALHMDAHRLEQGSEVSSEEITEICLQLQIAQKMIKATAQ